MLYLASLRCCGLRPILVQQSRNICQYQYLFWRPSLTGGAIAYVGVRHSVRSSSLPKTHRPVTSNHGDLEWRTPSTLGCIIADPRIIAIKRSPNHARNTTNETCVPELAYSTLDLPCAFHQQLTLFMVQGLGTKPLCS